MNKHDALIETIKKMPDNGRLTATWKVKNAVVSTNGTLAISDLKSLADEYEKLREMFTKAEHVGFKRFYIDRPYWGEDKESWYIFDFETDVRVSEKAFGSAIEAYSYLEAKQSGEDGK